MPDSRRIHATGTKVAIKKPSRFLSVGLLAGPTLAHGPDLLDVEQEEQGFSPREYWLFSRITPIRTRFHTHKKQVPKVG